MRTATASDRWPASLLVAAMVLGLLLVGHGPAEASTTSAREAERDLHALVNTERAQRGLGALTIRTDIVSVARKHSDVMASQGRLHHNPDFSTQITGWQRVSENVGYGPSVGAIHRALMESEGHRRNILDDRVTEIGIGVTIRDGRVWVTQNFRRPSTNVVESPPSTTSYGDVSSTSVHALSISLVTDRGIAPACGTARFCPADRVTRAEFASMLVNALGLPAATGSRFSDVSGPHAADIEALAEAGLTAGCSADRFCPDQRLTREQMATFLARALELAPASHPFTDVTRTHSGSIGALHQAGIISGCTSRTYCPTDPVTRAQTASMLARNFG